MDWKLFTVASRDQFVVPTHLYLIPFVSSINKYVTLLYK